MRAAAGREAAVALLAMGGPRRPEEVAPFLESLFADPEMIRLPRLLRRLQPWIARRVARRRAPLVIPKYAAIGYSPLVGTTEALAQALAALGMTQGLSLATCAGMRYGAPRAPDVLRALLEASPPADDRPVVLLPQYPFYSAATTGSSLADAEAAVAAHGRLSLRIERFGDHPLYLGLIEHQIRAALAEGPTSGGTPHVLFTAHGLPESYVRRGDPYRDEVESAYRTLVARLADLLPPERTHLSFQSRVGPVRWLRPYTDETIRRLGAFGVTSLLVVPFGFTCEHLETLEEIDILYRGVALTAGIRTFRRTPAPGVDPRYVELQLRLVQEALSGRGP